MDFCGLNPGCTIPPWDLDPPLFATDMGVGVGVRLVLEYLMLEIFFRTYQIPLEIQYLCQNPT